MRIVKCFAFAKREIMCDAHCEISRIAGCEMKFAHVRAANISHLQSKYFTAKRFHLPERANFVGAVSLTELRQKSTPFEKIGLFFCCFFLCVLEQKVHQNAKNERASNGSDSHLTEGKR